MVKIGVVGKNEFTVGFALAGIKDTIEVGEDPYLALKELKSKKDVGIIVIDESMLEKLELHQRSEIESSVEPVFIPISTKSEQESLRRLIKKSVGVDLWK